MNIYLNNLTIRRFDVLLNTIFNKEPTNNKYNRGKKVLKIKKMGGVKY